MTDLKTRKIPIEAAAVYTLFWDIVFFVSYQFTFVPEKIPKVRARSFWLTLPGLPVHALPVLNHNRTDHNTKPMEH